MELLLKQPEADPLAHMDRSCQILHMHGFRQVLLDIAHDLLQLLVGLPVPRVRFQKRSGLLIESQPDFRENGPELQFIAPLGFVQQEGCRQLLKQGSVLLLFQCNQLQSTGRNHGLHIPAVNTAVLTAGKQHRIKQVEHQHRLLPAVNIGGGVEHIPVDDSPAAGEKWMHTAGGMVLDAAALHIE